MPFGLTTGAMSADGRAMGRLLEFDFDGTEYHSTYTSFSETSAAPKVDATGGSDVRKVTLLDVIEELLTATIIDKSPGHAAYTAFEVGAEGELVYRPTGTGTGKKEHTVDVRVDSRSRRFERGGVTMFDVAFTCQSAIVVTTQS